MDEQKQELHQHSVPPDWYAGYSRPKRFTKRNATFCSVCGMVLAYRFRGISYVSRDYWAHSDAMLAQAKWVDDNEQKA